MELSEAAGGQPGEAVSYKEVYDNPNYSHIMIGGQPFFILPSGELSDHVPVPVQADQLTPRKMTLSSGQHIYEGGSSTYRSTSDYDTDSSNFKQESDSCPPIYEEIDQELPRSTNLRTHVSHVSPPDVVMSRTMSPQHRSNVRPVVNRPGPSNSMYYYSDTLKRRGVMETECMESDSGISSR